MAEKQPQLNGAYYGPSIPPPPPPKRHYHRPGRGSDCGLCCIFSLICKLIFAVVIIIGIAALIVWLIFRPINRVKFHATNVSLTRFNLTNNDLYYNLTLDISIRNPNKKIGVYYDRIEARTYYQDKRFDSVFLTPFYQGHKNTTVLRPVFEGQQFVAFGSDETRKFNQEKTDGVYNIYMKLFLKIRFKLGKLKTPKFKPKIECDLKIPLNGSDGKLADGVVSKRCKLDF